VSPHELVVLGRPAGSRRSPVRDCSSSPMSRSVTSPPEPSDWRPNRRPHSAARSCWPATWTEFPFPPGACRC